MPDNKLLQELEEAVTATSNSLTALRKALGNKLDDMKRQAAERTPSEFTEEEKKQRKQLRAARKKITPILRELIYDELVAFDTSDEIKGWIVGFKKMNNQLDDDMEDINEFLDMTERVAEVSTKVVSMIEKAAKLRPTP